MTASLHLAMLATALGESAREWERYVTSWTAWNHVRAATSLAAAALLTVGLFEA